MTGGGRQNNTSGGEPPRGTTGGGPLGVTPGDGPPEDGRAGGPLNRVTHQDLIHLVSAAHLGQLAREAGFGSVDLWGDHLSTPYAPTSHRVILVARLV